MGLSAGAGGALLVVVGCDAVVRCLRSSSWGCIEGHGSEFQDGGNS